MAEKAPQGPSQVKRKRKQYFVAARFQGQYIGIILLLMFVTAALCSYVVYYTTMVNLGEKLASVYPQGRLMSIVRMVNMQIILSVICLAPLVVVLGIFLSHRIAGPIYRMERYLRDVVTGNLSVRLTLRKGDELVNLADGINNVVDGLKNSVVKERSCIDHALADMDMLKKAIETKPIDESIAMDLFFHAKAELMNVKLELEKYRLPKDVS